MKKQPLIWKKPKLHIVWIRTRLATRRTFWKFLSRYKKIKSQGFWKKKHKLFAQFPGNFFFYNFKCLFKLTRSNRTSWRTFLQLSRYKSFHRLWHNLLLRSLFNFTRTIQPVFARLWPTSYGIRRLWQYTDFQMYLYTRKKVWVKLRKRWIWHRLIKKSVRVEFLARLKQYFAYNIAVRKFFNYRIPKVFDSKTYSHNIVNLLRHQKLVHSHDGATFLCRLKRVFVNDVPVKPTHILNVFDYARVHVRGVSLYKRLRQYYPSRKRKVHSIGTSHGTIFNKKLYMFIIYKKIHLLKALQSRYLSYYYFHRNLLQQCRMR